MKAWSVRVSGGLQLRLERWVRVCMCVYAHSVLSDSVTPWTVARQAPLSMGFPREEYWSGLPFLSPGDLSDPGIRPTSPEFEGRFFSTEPSGKPQEVNRGPIMQGLKLLERVWTLRAMGRNWKVLSRKMTWLTWYFVKFTLDTLWRRD